MNQNSQASSKMETKRIIISGEGGQGVQVISEILARAAFNCGKNISYIPQFGVEQRGGASVSYLIISDDKITYPKFEKANIVVVMSNRSIEAIQDRLDQNTLLIFDSTNIDDKKLQIVKDKILKFLSISAREYAKNKFTTKVTNMILLGALLNYLPEIDIQKLNQVLKERLGNVDQNLIDMDLAAIDYGLNYAKNPTSNELKGLEQIEIQSKFEDDQKSWERYQNLCKGCSLCIISCPQKALTFSNDLNFLGTQMPTVDIPKCTACTMCQLNCPDGAIKVTRKS